MSPESNARILLIEDFPMIREGMAKWLASEGFRVAAQVGSHSEALKALQAVPVELILLDLMLAEGDGMEFIRELRQKHPGVRILVFSMHDEMLYAERVLRAGADGYTMKQAPTAELLTAIRTVLGGEIYVSRRLAMHLVAQNIHRHPTRPEDKHANLSDRELHIFRLIGHGHSPRRIATDLGLSIKTVETHRENIKNKLNLQSSAEVMRRATLWVNAQGNPAEPPRR